MNWNNFPEVYMIAMAPIGLYVAAVVALEESGWRRLYTFVMVLTVFASIVGTVSLPFLVVREVFL